MLKYGVILVIYYVAMVIYNIGRVTCAIAMVIYDMSIGGYKIML